MKECKLIKYGYLDGVKPVDLAKGKGRTVPERLRSIFSFKSAEISMRNLHSLNSRRIGANCLPSLNIDWNYAYSQSSFFYKRKLAGYSLSVSMPKTNEEEILKLGWRSALLNALIHQETPKQSVSDTYIGLFVEVIDENKRMGIAGKLLERMKESGIRSGAHKLYIPLLLPSLHKKENVFQTIRKFGFNRRKDGEYEDHWLRLHTRMGATILGENINSHQYVFTEDEVNCIASQSPSNIEIIDDERVVIKASQGRYYGANRCIETGLYIISLPCVWVLHNLT